MARVLFAALFPLLALGWLWCHGAFFHAFDAPAWIAAAASAATAALLVSCIFLRRAVLPLVIVELTVLAAFLCVTPRQRFDNVKWQTSWRKTAAVRKLADGRYELDNVRDFHYRSEYDFDVRYRTVVLDPGQISSIDAVFSHWDDLETVAHSMLGLNFADGTTVVFSMETRLPEGKTQNAIDGFYHRYGLAMIAGTPEDLYGLRTDHRGETLYVYRVKADRKYMRKTVISLLERAGHLQRHPEFYNSLFRNCTTGMLSALPEANSMKINDIRLIFNGMAGNMLFEKDLIVHREGESFGSLRARSLVPGRCNGEGAPATHYRGESEARWLRGR